MYSNLNDSLHNYSRKPKEVGISILIPGTFLSLPLEHQNCTQVCNTWKQTPSIYVLFSMRVIETNENNVLFKLK